MTHTLTWPTALAAYYDDEDEMRLTFCPPKEYITMAELVAVSLFAAGYLAITMEHRLFMNKAATSLLLAVLLWILASLTLPINIVEHHLTVVGSDIFGLIIFLLTAMTLVEILVHYHLFDVVEKWLRDKHWTLYHMGWAMASITFMFSAILDNLTATIVAIQIARRLFPKKDLLAIGALIVIVSNAGGAFSPIGDVTTLMLWFAGKFSAGQIISQAILPSLTMAIVSSVILLKRLKDKDIAACDHDVDFKPSRSDTIIMIITLLSFLLPIGAAALSLPPYLGLLAGLGVVWVLIDFAKKARPQETHLGANIHKFLQQADIESLQFFVGILLAVGALHTLGILDLLTDAMLGEAPTWLRMVLSFIGLGVSSAIIDNVPITAAAISAFEHIATPLWTLLAISVGTGGSLLIIGSAAGVITMGMIKELTFTKYLKIGTYPAAIGFASAIVVWAIQYKLFF